jgi:hypothetical protein
MLKSRYPSEVQQPVLGGRSRKYRPMNPMLENSPLTRCTRIVFDAAGKVKRYNMQVDMPEQRGLCFTISALTFVNFMIGALELNLKETRRSTSLLDILGGRGKRSVDSVYRRNLPSKSLRAQSPVDFV